MATNSERDGTTQFAHEITSIIDRYRKEADLTYAETIGVLELVKQDLFLEALEDNED